MHYIETPEMLIPLSMAKVFISENVHISEVLSHWKKVHLKLGNRVHNRRCSHEEVLQDISIKV